MKGDWGICLEIRLIDKPCHDAKCLLLMEAIKVDFTGLKAAA